MDYLLSSIFGYILGSFPTAFILLKKVKKLDITTQGTGNVGAMNMYDVTQSKTLGILVLLIDALKGLFSVYLTLLFFPVHFIYPALALFFAVFSHCFNPWLKLKGGRGLATAAGGTLMLFPVMPGLWLAIWFISYFLKKDIIFSNVLSSVMSLLIILSASNTLYKYSYPQADTIPTLILFTVGVLSIILIKHIEPLQELINKKNYGKNKNE